MQKQVEASGAQEKRWLSGDVAIGMLVAGGRLSEQPCPLRRAVQYELKSAACQHLDLGHCWWAGVGDPWSLQLRQ